MGVIGGATGEEGAKRVVPRDDKTSKVGEELATDVEDDEEEIERSKADDAVGFGDAHLLLDVVKGGVLGELSNGAQSVI